MRFFLGFLLLFVAGSPSPEIRYFRYLRAVEHTPATAKQTCFALAPEIFSEAAPGLADLRLYRGPTETPYAIQTADPLTNADQEVTPLNPGRSGGRTVFDAAMPQGSYSDVELTVTGKNFIATVSVSGSGDQAGAPATEIGSYTIFDLTGQKLGRSTVLHLPQSNFRTLHFRIGGPIAPDAVKGITVLRMATFAPRYATVVESQQVTQQGHNSVFVFRVPPHTPVDRVTFVPGAQPANFSRDVQIRAMSTLWGRGDERPQPVESAANILRVHRVESGHAIDEERLSVDAPEDQPEDAAIWTVTIDNQDDKPIAFTSARLEMVERDLCFDAAAGGGYRLYYGDAALAAPRYDYASLFAPQADAAQAKAGVETANSAYQRRPDTRPLTERNPALLWGALAGAIAVLGWVALRAARQQADAAKS